MEDRYLEVILTPMQRRKLQAQMNIRLQYGQYEVYSGPRMRGRDIIILDTRHTRRALRQYTLRKGVSVRYNNIVYTNIR